MTDIHVPAEAVEAAHSAFMDAAAQPNGMHDPEGAREAALTAAAPMIAGAWLRKRAKTVQDDQTPMIASLMKRWLEQEANRIDPEAT